MGLQSHRKISTVCVILILMCTFGLQVILAAATKTSSASVDSVEDVDGESTTKLDLDKSETKDAQKVEIVKQIQKVNNDGSYTVGYEAEDGTFKIESRDVLGNVKGTFGYVDGNGEIKRVSYTASNGTGLKNVPAPESSEDVIAIPRYNRSTGTPTTRRPAGYSLSSSSLSPTRSTVIQSIPRRLRVLSSSSSSSTERPTLREFSSASPSSSTTKSSRNDPTTTVVYATSVPTPKSYVNIRPTPLPGSNIRPPEQIARPEKLEINHVSKVQISSNRDTLIAKPVVEDIDEKLDDKKSIRGNALRRQLQEPENKYESRQPILYSQSSGDDATHIYGPVTNNQRPLFTTTAPTTPRIPALLLAARQRAANIQTAISSSTQSGPEKYYIKSVRKDEDVENDATTESTSEHQYLTQSPIPVQIPANRFIGQNIGVEEKRFVRKQEQISDGRYRNPEFVRIPSSDSPRLIRIPIPQNNQQTEEHEQYLRETTTPSSKTEQGEEQEPIPIPIRPPQPFYRNTNQQYYVLPQHDHMTGYLPQPYGGSYQQQPPFRAPPNYYPDYNNERPPLTARDFERLLQILIYRHQRYQRVGYNNIGNGLGYTPYPVEPYQIPVRVPLYNPYDGRPPYRNPIPLYPETENMYQAQNPIPSADPSMSYELQRLIPRKKQYNPRYFGAQNPPYNMEDYGGAQIQGAPQGHSAAYLPADVREELLYRMLMLALNAEPQIQTALGSSQVLSTIAPDLDSSTTTKSPISYKKPVRSVQILGEEQ